MIYYVYCKYKYACDRVCISADLHICIYVYMCVSACTYHLFPTVLRIFLRDTLGSKKWKYFTGTIHPRVCLRMG